jgi:hypothetical protein
MSDEASQDKVNKWVEEIDAFLTSFEKTMGLTPKQNVQAPKALSMHLDDIRKRSPDELTQLTYEISQYSLYLRQVINRKKALEKWAKAKLDELAAHYVKDVAPHHGFGERILVAKHNPAICKKLNQFIRKVTLELDTLYAIPDQMQVLSDSIKEMKFIAFRKEKQHASE